MLDIIFKVTLLCYNIYIILTNGVIFMPETINIFSPIEKTRFYAKNRLVRSATGEYMTDEKGYPTPELLNLYENLAKGGVGTIIASAAQVFPSDEESNNFLLRINAEDCIKPLQALTDAVKKHGVLIWQQIMIDDFEHKDSSGKFRPCPIDEMSREEIDIVINAHIKGAEYAEKAGFDGVQIHAAHGFLLSRFLSPKYNHRQDEYGQNPLLIIEKILAGTRRAVNDEFHISIKINCQDFEKSGLTEEDCLKYCLRLAELGIDSIEISGNETSRKSIVAKVNEAYFKNVAIELKKHIDTPVILVGGHRSIEMMNDLMAKSHIDALSLSRPLISEPDLPNRWQSGDTRPSRCISCNKCYAPTNGKCFMDR